jgi:hypothetical protein
MKFGAERGKNSARVRRWVFIRRRARLVTPSDEEASTAARGSQARLRAVNHARRGDEDDPPPFFFDEEVFRARLGCAGPVLVGLLMGSCGQVSLFLYLLLFLFSFFMFSILLI